MVSHLDTSAPDKRQCRLSERGEKGPSSSALELRCIAPAKDHSITPHPKGRKRSREPENLSPSVPAEPSPKRPRASVDTVDTAAARPAVLETDYGSIKTHADAVEYWVNRDIWPKKYFETDTMSHLLVRRGPPQSLRRKRSEPSSLAASSTTPSWITPSDQRPREERSTPYQNPRYKILLETKGSYMEKSELDITDESKNLCRTLLQQEQATPDHSLFNDDIFERACRKLQDKNEARVVQDIARLIVPSAESLATFGAKELEILVESVNEGWNSSVPLTNTRPQPDYSVGFKREAFSVEQRSKLAPFIGDFINGDQTYFMATYYMYFPFLTSEVKCGAAALDVADRQNAHSMTLAVRAVVELFRLVQREKEINRSILAFSISHDHRAVRLFGHYAVIDGPNTTFYRHPIHEFIFTALDGQEKWRAYTFTKNVYDIWMPTHFQRLCSAIDDLPPEVDFEVPPLQQDSGLSQDV